MSCVECVSITAGITAIIHFAGDSLLCCFDAEYGEKMNFSDLYDKICLN